MATAGLNTASLVEYGATVLVDLHGRSHSASSVFLGCEGVGGSCVALTTGVGILLPR